MDRLYLWTFQLVNKAFSRLSEVFSLFLAPLVGTILITSHNTSSMWWRLQFMWIDYVARITLPESGFKSLVRSARSVPALIRYTSVALKPLVAGSNNVTVSHFHH